MSHRFLVFLLVLWTAAAHAQKPAPCQYRDHDVDELKVAQMDQSRSSSMTHIYAFNPCWNLAVWTWHLVDPITLPGQNPGPEVDLTTENETTYAIVKGFAVPPSQGFTDTVHVALYDANHVYLCHVDFSSDDNKSAWNTEIPSKDNNGEYVRVPFARQCGENLLSRYQTVRLWVSWDPYKKPKPIFSGFQPVYLHH